MAAVEIRSEEPARTLGGILDAAAERIAAAGCETPAATPKRCSPTLWA